MADVAGQDAAQAGQPTPPRPDRALEGAYQYALTVVDRLLGELEAFPHTTERGRWRVSAHGRWTAGFWIGLVWLRYLERPTAGLRAEADAWLARLAPRQHDTTTHDMGFLFEPSFVRGYLITGEPAMRDVALQAARSLATRYHGCGGYIQAWDESEDPAHRGRTIVDTVMNLPLLLWAAEVTGEAHLRDIALRTAQTTADHHVRADGSTYHVVDFDPDTGGATRYGTHQGYSDNSCWSRGQAWALYGFCRLSMLTGEARWLETSRRLADFFLAHLPADGLPYWDLLLPSTENEPRDSAAAAIAASGLLDLAAQVPDAHAGAHYRTHAERILEVLTATCLTRGRSAEQGVLLHGTVDRPRDSAVDVSIVYGDHYFVEALTKVLRPERRHLLDAAGVFAAARGKAVA